MLQRPHFTCLRASTAAPADRTTLRGPDGAVLACYGLTLLAVGGNTRWVHLGLEQARWAAIARAIGEATMLLLVLCLVHGTGDLARVPLAQFVGDGLAALAMAIWLGSRTRPIRVEWNWKVARPVLVAGWPLASISSLAALKKRP